MDVGCAAVFLTYLFRVRRINKWPGFEQISRVWLRQKTGESEVAGNTDRKPLEKDSLQRALLGIIRRDYRLDLSLCHSFFVSVYPRA